MLNEYIVSLDLNSPVRDSNAGSRSGLTGDSDVGRANPEGARNRDLSANLEDAGASLSGLGAGSERTGTVVGEGCDADDASARRPKMASTTGGCPCSETDQSRADR